MFGLTAAQLPREVAAILARTRNPRLQLEGAYARACARLDDASRGDPAARGPMEEFLEQAPDDPRGAALLKLAIERAPDQQVLLDLDDRVLRHYPGSPIAAAIRGRRRQSTMIGRPFPPDFTGAITEDPVSVARLRGKVVVIDFWATWSAPCVAEMPELKRLHAQYHSRGVEFIGVSLDFSRRKAA